MVWAVIIFRICLRNFNSELTAAFFPSSSIENLSLSMGQEHISKAQLNIVPVLFGMGFRQRQFRRDL